MIKFEDKNFPEDCRVIHNDFFNYDPVHSFTEADNVKYLNEDLLQCAFPEEDMIIDLGWYGDLASNKGEFKLLVIKDGNWEIPFNVIHTKSAAEIRQFLLNIFQYYTSIDTEEESEIAD